MAGSRASPLASSSHQRRSRIAARWEQLSIGMRLVLIATVPQLLYTNVMTWLGNETLHVALARVSQKLAPYPDAVRALNEIYADDGQFVFVLISFGLGLLVAIAALAVARKIREKLDLVRVAAVRIAAGDLETRVALVGKSEIGKLAQALDHVRDALVQRIALEQQAVALEKDLVLAKAVESLILPSEREIERAHLGVAVFHRAATRVSGDFWHQREDEQGTMWLVVGDVVGSGPGPAMIAAAILATYRLEARHGADRDGALLVKAMHETAAATAQGRHPASVCLLRVPRSGPLTCWCAGAEPPLIVRRTGELDELPAGGTPLGASKPGTADRTIELGPGDRILVYTGGAGQADSNGSARAWARGLSARTPGMSAVETRDHAARSFEAEQLREDVTVLVMERRDGVAP